MTLRISSVRVRRIQNGRDGLIAWVSCVIDDALRLNNIALRRGDRGLFLTYPAKQTGSGARFHYFHPITRDAGEALEQAVARTVVEMVGDAELSPKEADQL